MFDERFSYCVITKNIYYETYIILIKLIITLIQKDKHIFIIRKNITRRKV